MPAQQAAVNKLEFLEFVDEARMSAIQPYRVIDSDRTVQDIFAENNASSYDAYGPDFRINRAPGKILVDPPVRYEVLLDDLASIRGMKFMTNRDMMRSKCPADEIWCNLRHDVDSDMRGQLDQAEMEAARGIKSTFFTLHTTSYYGTFKDGVLHRNKSMLEIYRAIQDMGHEIALHTDGLHLFQNLNINGAEAIVTEIKWLRDNGIDLVGTTAHNSPAAYGCNNYSIFKGRQVTNVLGSRPRGVIFNGKWAPLQLLDERELGLEYEANDLFWQAHTHVEYAALRGQDSWRAASNMSRLRLATANGKSVEQWLDQDGLIEYLRALPLKGYFLVLSVHCLYYGLRHNRRSNPTRRLATSTSAINSVSGWPSCEPFELEAAYCDDPGKQRYQSINITNELGFIDRPLFWQPARPVDTRIAFMGRDNFHGATIGLESHLHSRVQAESWRRFKKTFRCWNVSSPVMGLGRSVALIDWIGQEIKPDYLVIGIGADEIELSLPEFWHDITGYDPEHSPGAYLTVDAGSVAVEQPSTIAGIYKSPPVPRGRISLSISDAGLPSQQKFMEVLADLNKITAGVLARIIAIGVNPVLMIEECGESANPWLPGSAPSPRVQAHANFKSYLRSWLGHPDVTVIDPYERFLQLPATQPSHWDDGRSWNHRGHRIAAELLMEFLGAQKP
jgi:hypothetical protein